MIATAYTVSSSFQTFVEEEDGWLVDAEIGQVPGGLLGIGLPNIRVNHRDSGEDVK